MWKLSFTTIVLVVLLTARLCNGDCNVCNSNGAACVSSTTFQLCFSGTPQGTVYSCPNPGDVCTRLGLICADPSANTNIQADCGNTEQCGNCAGVSNGGYACTSHTTFTMCQGEVATSLTFTCPSNEVCLTSRANDGVSPCASQCLSNIQDMCDIESTNPSTITPTTETPITESPITESPITESPITESPITETPITASPTTESSSSSSTGTTLSVEDMVCSSQTLVGRYRNPNDATCRTYIYCSMDRTTRKLVGRPMTCPGSRYFNQGINSCQDALPAGCTQ